jgi:hypothetical protein
MVTTNFWSPDVEVAVQGDELIIRFDHLPAADHSFAAEIENGEMLIHSETLAGIEDGCLHVALPEDLVPGDLETALLGEAFEVHMRVPAL